MGCQQNFRTMLLLVKKVFLLELDHHLLMHLLGLSILLMAQPILSIGFHLLPFVLGLQSKNNFVLESSLIQLQVCNKRKVNSKSLILDELWTAQAGRGALKNGFPIKVSATEGLFFNVILKLLCFY